MVTVNIIDSASKQPKTSRSSLLIVSKTSPRVDSVIKARRFMTEIRLAVYRFSQLWIFFTSNGQTICFFEQMCSVQSIGLGFDIKVSIRNRNPEASGVVVIYYRSFLLLDDGADLSFVT